ncbi:MAG: LysE family translocator [Eudoraea sp.]|nr:LysE family translocator [Eudoraea sp.]
MNYEIISAFILASAALAISPGPDNIFVLTQSVAYGKQYGIATTAGLVSGCLVHTALLAFGVSAIISGNENLYFYIKLFGAIYLCYLAYKVLTRSPAIDLGRSVTKKGLFSLFRQGFIMNVLNPKVTVFFLAFFPGFLFSDTLNTVIQFFILGFIFMGVTFVIFGSIALLSGGISASLKENKRMAIALKWLQVTVFIAIAIYLLLSEK